MKESISENTEISNHRIFKQVVASKTERPGIIETPETKKAIAENENSSGVQNANESQDYKEQKYSSDSYSSDEE